MDVGANLIAGSGENIIECAKKMLESNSKWENPNGHGDAAELTLQSILTDYSTEFSNIEEPEQIQY